MHIHKYIYCEKKCNTNCLTLVSNCPSIPKRNFTCLTRLDHNRSLYQLATKANVKVSDVKNVVVWGKAIIKKKKNIFIYIYKYK